MDARYITQDEFNREREDSKQRLEAIKELFDEKIVLMVSELRGDIKAINAKLDMLSNRISWGFALGGIAVGFMGIFIALFRG